MRRAVIDLASSRPLWSAPADTLAEIRRAFGADWQVDEVRAVTSSDGDGGPGSPEACRLAADAEVYIGWGVPEGVARAASGSIRWAHTAAAGAGGSLSQAFHETGAVLTSSRGMYAEPIADTLIAAIAFCVRGFHEAVQAQAERRWAKDRFTTGEMCVGELAGTRVGIVGFGGIGQALARRCAALGMPVRAVRRNPAKPVSQEVVWVRGPDAVRDLARESDVLVLSVPGTGQTAGLIGPAVLDALPAGAFLVNMARGTVLDEEAVLAHLESGRLAGCVLDVFREEPLPQEHPFWGHPRVLVLPHVSGVSDRFWKRESALIVGNIERYLRGERLDNEVDLEAGY